MDTFEIKYFNGKTSKTHQGTLKFHSNYWEINLDDLNENSFNPIIWHLENIQKSEFVGNTNLFKYGDFPQQTLECNHPEFINTLSVFYPKHSFFKKEYFWALNKGVGVFIGIIMASFLCFFGIYKFLLPPLAERIAMSIPQEYEIKWGNKIFENMIKAPEKTDEIGLEITQNDSLSTMANAFVKQLDIKTNYPIKITVANEDVLNAFALPGGNIVVYHGLIKKLKNKEDFAALIGHEIAHVKNKHTLKNLFKNLAGYLFISLITTDLNGIAAILIENGNMISNLGFSRELEAEADANAMQFLKDNKLNTKGLFQLLKTLEMNAGKNDIPEILSSHPLTKDRMKYASQNQLKNEITSINPVLDSIWKQIKDYKQF